MTELIQVTLENEMDLTLAYKRSISTSFLLGLTVSTQTTFATAVSEICREVIDKADEGVLKIGVDFIEGRYTMVALISLKTNEALTSQNPGVEYAKKLVPILEVNNNDGVTQIWLKMGIPRSTRMDQLKIRTVQKQIESDGPVSAYEEVKLKNAFLADLNQQNEEALQQASVMDQLKTEFLSVASHELNSPLTILLGLSQLAKSKAGHEPFLEKILTKVEDQTKKIISLVRQLMDVSKFEHGEVAYDQQVIPVHRFFSDLKDAMTLLAPKHHLKININCEGSVYADALRLEQVVNNLINNAAKYSTPGSTITLDTYNDDDHLHLSVSDVGIGMTPETRDKIFGKFFREKGVEKKYNGLGMGLYIVNRIVADHGGEITVDSTLGKGSVFTVRIPRYHTNPF